MSAFPDDFLRLHLEIGSVDLTLHPDLDWPPPARIVWDGAVIREAEDDDPPAHVLVRIGYSRITDEQRAGIDHVVRGAEYKYQNDALNS